MKPDLTYYHNSSLPFEKFLILSRKKNPSALSNHKPKKQQKFTLNFFFKKKQTFRVTFDFLSYF